MSSEPDFDAIMRNHEQLTRARAAYIRAGQEPPSTAELLAAIEAEEQTPQPPAEPHMNAGAGNGQRPAPRPPSFDDILRSLCRD